MSDLEYQGELRTFSMRYRIIETDTNEGYGAPFAEVLALTIDKDSAERIVNALNDCGRRPGQMYFYEEIPTEGPTHPDRTVQPK